MIAYQRFAFWCRQGLMVLAATFGGGCGDAAAPYKDVIRDQAKAYDEVAQLLSTVTDESSMKAAQTELRKRLKRCEAIGERGRDLPSPTIAIREQVYEESAKLKQVLSGVVQQLGRIKALPGGEDFLKPFDQGRGFLGVGSP